MSNLTEEKIKVQVERLRTYAAHNPSAIITEVADALAAVREEQAGEIARLINWPADWDVMAYPTPQDALKETAAWLLHDKMFVVLKDEIARLREANAELLEGLRQIAGWNTDNAAVRIARALIAKHGGK